MTRPDYWPSDLDYDTYHGNGDEPPAADVTPQDLAAAFARLMATRFPPKRQEDDAAGLAARRWDQR